MGKHSEIGLHLYNNCSHKWTETEERPILTFCFPRGGGKDHRSFSLTYNGNLLIAALTRSKIQDSEVDNHLWVLVIACNFSHSFGFLHIPLTKADSLNNESFYGTHYTGELTTSGCFFFFFFPPSSSSSFIGSLEYLWLSLFSLQTYTSGCVWSFLLFLLLLFDMK